MTVPAPEEDAATAALWEQGTVGIEVRAAGTPGDAEVALLAYFPDAAGLRAAVTNALAAMPRARVQPAAVPEVDWVARFREGFRPFRSAGFLVSPPWEAPATLARAAGVLIVDPGRAFGTGTHESTRLCLRLLRERAVRAPLGRVLDLGTGSGILAVAAARLGARSVTAVDLDAEAVASARHHAGLNGVELRVVRADLAAAFRPGAFDLILANISTPLLVARRREILALEAPAVVLSGLLATDAESVRAIYQHGGRVEVHHDGEWAALLVELQAP